jgi:uncharacterized membrane protein
MNQSPIISTTRLEAFSDGVIAIILTVMVFDLKITEPVSKDTVWTQLYILFPKFISYCISFVVLAIMWINHHQLFHQIKNADGKLIWLNINLLFWMSIVPLVTNFIGNNPLLWQPSFFYGIVFALSAFSFTLLRKHAIDANLLHHETSKDSHVYVLRKNIIAISLYLLASAFSFLSVYISFIIFLLVPAMYFIPITISTHEEKEFN